MEHLVIRAATIKDIELLQKISRQTFSETFSVSNTEENMTKYLTEELSAEKLSAELTDIHSEFYFAIHNNNIIGYLKLNEGESQTEIKDKTSLEIERIYVLKEYHRKKVGQLLYEKAIQVARHKQAAYVWLGVWEENKRAQAFYTKNGFVEFDKHFFTLGDDVQTDIMMKLQLV
jgi:ribosomal protein S18 acetylase RimI-like enzyme